MIMQVNEGATLREVGTNFGMSRERVRQILKREGIEVGALPGRREAKARRRLERARERGPLIEEMWRKGMSYRQIARGLGASQRSVKAVLQERVSREERLARAAQRHSEQSRMPDEWALQALREAARTLERTPSCRAYEQLRAGRHIEGPTASLITARWGWSAACEMAGLEPNATRAPRHDVGSRRYSDEDLRAALERVSRELGHPPSVSEYDAHRQEGDPTAVTIRHRHGGSWLRARSTLLT